MKKLIRIHSLDNVAVAVCALAKGQPITEGALSVTPVEDISAGHKIALFSIAKGEKVVKYGFPIGIAKTDIPAGAWVHTHNLQTGLGDLLTYSYHPSSSKTESLVPLSFNGFARSDGRVGVRNEVWVIPTVGCVNNVATEMARRAKAYLHGSVEDIVAFPHPYGCSQMGDDQENTRRILADLVCHPNAGAVLVLGLGCENSNVGELKKYIGPYDEHRVKFLVCQEVEDEQAEGARLLQELVDYASRFERIPLPVSELVVGLKCGGSDGFSGITANPVIGAFSDRLVAMGGATMLTEVPEMFGAETLLMNRCKDKATFDQTVSLVNGFKAYFQQHGQTIYENPSPGNKQGGISTLEDKSLGCTQKSGSSPVSGVLHYAERITGKGLHLLSAPGNDLVASTALAASGAQIVLFSTGRGTPFACPVPTVKISSNSALANHKSGWVDFDAGSAVRDQSIDALGEELLRFVLQVASGKKVKSEEAGFHDLAIFKNGVTL